MASGDYDPLAAYLKPTFFDKVATALQNPETKLRVYLAGFIFLAVAVLYGGFLQSPLVFDDYNVLNEAKARSPFSIGLRWLSADSFALSYFLFGSQWSWFRLENLVLHGLTATTLFGFYLRLLSIALPKPSMSVVPHAWLACGGAVFFALHPAAVYGVAYLAERSIVMATLFGVLALYAYLLGVETGRSRWYALAIFCYFLALSSKEHAIMLPGVAVALSLLLRRPSVTKRYSVWMGVAVVIVAAFALLFVRYQKGLIGTAYEPQAFEILSQMRMRGWGVSLDNAFLLSIVTQTYQFFHYLLLWVVPYVGWMSIDVRQPFAIGLFELPYAIGFVGFCLIPLLSVRLIWQGGQKGLLGFGLICPWILFLPELAVVRVAEVFVIYRSYLWMGLFPLAIIALAAGLTRRVALVLGGVVGIVIFSLSLNRLDTFSDHIKLWTDAIESNRGKMNQGAERAYFKRGMAHREFRRYNEAIDDFKAGYALLSTSNSYAKAGDRGVIYFQFNYLIEVTEDLAEVHRLTEVLREHPESAATHLERGKVFVRLLNPAQAVNDFSRSLQLDPKNADALRNRAMVLFKAGGVSDSLSDLNRAIEINPRFAKAYMNRGIVLAAKRQPADALNDLAKAVSLDPRDPEIHFNRGNVHLLMGRFDEAFGYFTQAIELDPKLADAFVNRGGIYMQRGRYTEAVKEFDKALALNPDIENAYLNRARIYLAMSEKKKAMDDLGSVLKLNHVNKEALLQRGLLLLEEKHIREARISLQRSCDAGSEAGCAKAKELSPI